MVAVGKFDGVHLGHQQLLSFARKAAADRGWSALAYTFPPDPPALLPLSAKVRLLRELVDEVEVAEWERVRGLSAQEFLQTELVGRLSARALVMGPDHRFGRGREGTPELAKRLGDELGLEVHVVSPAAADGEVISSQRIRELLASGEVERAATLLGRAPVLFGQPVSGAGLARTLGYPTLNLHLDPVLVRPRDGVYLAWAFWRGGAGPGLFYHGKRPTFPELPPSVELHLLSSPPALPPPDLEVHLLRFLRPDMCFPSKEALVQQISRDLAVAQGALGSLPRPRPIFFGL